MGYLSKSIRSYTPFLFLPFCFLTISQSYAQWESKDTGVNVGLFDVHFVNEKYGWAVGDSGAIIRTTDGGDTWELQRFKDPPVIFYAVHFVDTTHGWTVGGGTILRTNDGGTSWTEYFTDTYVPLWDVHFVDTNNGWVVGGWQPTAEVYGVILKTTDAGITWTNTIDSSRGGFQGVYFLNENEGWAVGGKDLFDNFSADIIVHTTDGGSSWIEQTTPTEGPLYRVTFVNEMLGWAAGFSTLGETVALKTTDGGMNWQTVEFQQGPGSDIGGLLDVCAPDPWNVWIVRAKSVYRSTDGGTSFSRVDPDSGTTFISCSISSNLVWISGGSDTPPPNRMGKIWKYLSPISSVSQEEDLPMDFVLEQNFPNPFNPTTVIRYNTNTFGRILLKLYDVKGNLLRTLIDKYEYGGEKSFVLDGSELASGIYFCRLEFGGKSLTRRLVLIR